VVLDRDHSRKLCTFRDNGKDEPTIFQQPCKNALFGCESRHGTTWILTDHDLTCPYTSVEHAEVLRKAVGCTQCDVRFDNEVALQRHVKLMHDKAKKSKPVWIPKSCDKSDCDEGPFKTRNAWHMHIYRQ
jgi:hypothetical protein